MQSLKTFYWDFLIQGCLSYQVFKEQKEMRFYLENVCLKSTGNA